MPGSRLYAILDVDACEARGLPVLAVAEGICRAAPAFLQLRAKGRSAAEVRTLLAHLRPIVPSGRTLLFLNDRADLAELAGCDGVHVGQSDLPAESVRKHFPRLRVGVSTHSEAEFESALADTPDYLALGPIFSTASKLAPEPTVGLAELARLAPRARAAGVPLVAIGGITRESAPMVLAQADHVAAISALLPDQLEPGQSVAGEVARLTRAYVDALPAG